MTDMARSAPRALRTHGGGAAQSDLAALAAVATAVQRLAVLLSAGVPPAAAWGYLADGAVVRDVAQAAHRGDAVPRAITDALANDGVGAEENTAWRALAAAWAVASEVGAPLAPTLRGFAFSLRSQAQAQREIAVALAAPAATARMVLALPVVGILFGLALGFNTVATLASPFGLGCLVVGAVLMLIATRWSRAMVRKARPRDLTPGLEHDLTAIAVTGGGSLDRARDCVTRAMEENALERSGAPPDAVLELSRRAGVPAAELLRSEAEELRRAARAETQRRVESLSVTLMLPLGLCVLPAFMVVGVLPLVFTIVGSTVGEF
jgi:tight adherence protein B